MSSMCGPRAKVVVALDIALATYGICVAYMVTIGDQYDRIFASLIGNDFCKHWYLERKFTMLITSSIVFPICLMKRLDFLRHTGPLGIFAMLYVVFLSVYEYFQTENTPAANTQEPEGSVSQVIACIPVILFGFQCNEVIVPIYASLKDRKLSNFIKAALAAYSVLCFLFSTVGVFGYLSYGPTVAANLMLMFNASDPLVLVGIVALIFKLAVTYPQMAFAGREAATDIVHEFGSQTADEVSASENCCRIWSSVVWFTTSLVFAMFAPNIGIVLQALGILAAVNVFILPAICIIQLTRRKDLTYSLRMRICFVLAGIVLFLAGCAFIYFVVLQVYADIKHAMAEGTKSLCRLP